MISEEVACKYLYELPGPTLQFARWFDWVCTYVTEEKKSLQLEHARRSQYSDAYANLSRENLKILTLLE